MGLAGEFTAEPGELAELLPLGGGSGLGRRLAALTAGDEQESHLVGT